MLNPKEQKRQKRHRKIRSRVFGDAKKPRLVVSRSLRNISVQMIDDSVSKTVAFASTLQDKKKTGTLVTAKEVGIEIAKKAKELKIKECVFDRNGYKFHGKVQAVAEGAREGGLNF